MALGINPKTAAGLLVKLACRLFGESFWNWGERVRFGLIWSTFLKMVSLLRRRRGARGERGKGEGGIFDVFYVFFWFRHRFLFLVTIINLLQQNVFH